MSWKALTVKVRFTTAQFKEHSSRLVRRTYLIPLPSTIAGFFGAIMGYSRQELYEKSDELYAGAELLGFEGKTITYARIFKFDRDKVSLKKLLTDYYNLDKIKDKKKRENILKDIQGLLTIKESEELYKPYYKFAIASTDLNFIDELYKRLKNYDFVFEPFGGNDYHLVELISDLKIANNLIMTDTGRGYCKIEDFEEIRGENAYLIPARVIAGVNTTYLQVYRADIKLKKETHAVDDGESKIFVYKVKDFLVYGDQR